MEHSEYRLKRSKDYFRDKVISKIEEKLKESKEVLDYSSIFNDYRGIDAKYEIVCPKHGSFMEYPYRLMRGPRMSKVVCKACRREQFEEKKKTILEERRRRAKERIISNIERSRKVGLYGLHKAKDPNKALRTALKRLYPTGYDFSGSKYPFISGMVKFKCDKHGDVEINLKSLRITSEPCPMCKRTNKWDSVRIPVEVVERFIANKYGDKYTLIRDTYRKGEDQFEVRCAEHGIWKTVWRTLQRSGCHQCFVDRNKVTFEKFVELATKIHKGRFTYPKEENADFSASGRVIVMCKEHGLFETSAGDHTRMTRRATGCPLCTESEGETIVRHVLNNLGVNYIRQYRVGETLMRFDFFIPNPGIAIEYNGYQHYHIVKHFGGREGLIKRMKNDKYKANWCKRNEHHLQIFKYDIPYQYLGSRVVRFLKEMKLPKSAFISEEYYKKYKMLK